MYDIQELGGGISMDAVILRVRHTCIYSGGWKGFHNANIMSTSDQIEGGEPIKINLWIDDDEYNLEYTQKEFNSLVDDEDIEVYVRNQ